MFMAPGSHVIEFAPDPETKAPRLCFYRLAASMAHEFYTVTPTRWDHTATGFGNVVELDDVMDRMRMAGLLLPAS
jgi:hypothetical protein